VKREGRASGLPAFVPAIRRSRSAPNPLPAGKQRLPSVDGWRPTWEGSGHRDSGTLFRSVSGASRRLVQQRSCRQSLSTRRRRSDRCRVLLGVPTTVPVCSPSGAGTRSRHGWTGFAPSRAGAERAVGGARVDARRTGAAAASPPEVEVSALGAAPELGAGRHRPARGGRDPSRRGDRVRSPSDHRMSTALIVLVTDPVVRRMEYRPLGSALPPPSLPSQVSM